MSRPFILFLSFVFAGSLQAALAQNTIASIRKAYQEQKQVIAEMNDDFPSGGYPPVFYELNVVENLPATGLHRENLRFYFGELPDDSTPYPPHYLSFVTSKYNFAAREFYEEYLYDDKGQVMFIYAMTPDFDFPKIHEFRFYFDGARLLRLSIKEGLKEESKEIYNGNTIPESYAEFCSYYTSRASRLLDLFKSIESNKL